MIAILEEQYKAKKELCEYMKYNRIERYFPDTGTCARHLYKKHLEFFEAGVNHRLRAFIAANRVGKTESTGGYELVCHLTGNYPKWWNGFHFSKAIRACCSGKTNTATRDILQLKLAGSLDDLGTGLIPKKYIHRFGTKRGVPGALEFIDVKHNKGGISRLDFKSYEQGVKAFEGFEADCILLDEEPPEDIYGECLIRLMMDKGLLILTFTPFYGMSNVVLEFLKEGITPVQQEGYSTKYVVMAGWDDAPHLTPEIKAEMIKIIPAYQIDARTKGIPRLGAGAIYTTPEEGIVIDPFELPNHWPRGYALDVGWNATAAIWGAEDRETGTIYLYSEYKKGREEPAIHAQAIRARGDWLTGAIDPSSRGRSQKDGEQMIQLYRENGLRLVPADNTVEAGIFDTGERLAYGKLKIFSTLAETLKEYRLYRRDDTGHVVKKFDHLMDCMRYLIRTKHIMRVKHDNAVSKRTPEYGFLQNVSN